MNGILLIDKPKQYTSHDIVAIVKKITGEKVGHTGTLDPNATGVLPLLIGKATRISKYLINHDKTYIATLKLGFKTDTADSEGTIIEEKEIPKLTEEIVKETLNSMIGKQTQVPPMYSAIKVNGKKLYEYARQGKTVEVQGRNIEIYNMKLIEFKLKEAEVVYEILCSKGTYIRTVCENIAEKLNTVGYMKELRRSRVGEFDIQDSINIEEIKENKKLLEEKIISIEKFFKNKQSIELSNYELKLFLDGVQLNKEIPDGTYKLYNKKFIGIGIINKGLLKRDLVI